MQPNYSGNKKRKEEARRKKQEEKRNRRLNRSHDSGNNPGAVPESAEPNPQPGNSTS